MSTAANRPHSVLRRLWCRLGGQQGFVLPATVGMCAMLTMAGTTVVAYSTSSARTSSRSSADQSAYALAEAGVNNAMSVLSEPSNNALDPYLLPARTTPYAVIGPMIGSTVILGQSVTTSFPLIRIVPNGMPTLQKTIYAQPSPPTGYSG